MQLRQLLILADQLRQDPTIAALTGGAQVYYRHEGAWFNEERSKVADAVLAQDLEETLRREERHWKRPGKLECFVPLREMEAVLVPTFQISPRKATRDRVVTAVDRCHQIARDRFAATHDKLTGLLNREGFNRELDVAIEKWSRSTNHEGSERPSGAGLVGVIAFDIDHFKQINDTYGHNYGDVVLKSFALRLAEAAGKRVEELGNRSTIVLGRMGGEEFNAVILGQLTPQELHEFADRLRLTIGEQQLPNERELTLCREQLALTGVLPAPADRVVHASVGVAWTPLTENSDVRKLLEKLTGQADAALYRAKAGGRNCTRAFADILARFGRVLTNHEAIQDVVLVDLGAEFGVKKGQEFVVFHPDFSGGVPFVMDDGRTRRKIGTYPKYPCGRIVVVEVQPNLSVCKVVDRVSQHFRFPAGSAVEAVPLGSITHILGPQSFSMAYPTKGKPADVTSFGLVGQSFFARDKRPAAFVLRIGNAASIAEELGSAYLNQALAKAYMALVEALPFGTEIAQLDDSSFCALVPVEPGTGLDDVFSGILEAVQDACGKQVDLVAGGASELENKKVKRDFGVEKFSPDAIVDKARFAASEGAQLDARNVEVFDASTAARVVQYWRQKGEVARALADYEKLKELGVSYARLENNAGLCYYVLGEMAAAGDRFSAAVKLAPNESIHRANLAVSLFFLGRRDEALTHFADELRTFKELPESYQPVHALCLYSEWQLGRPQMDATDLLQYMRHSAALKNSLLYGAYVQELKTGITALSQGLTTQSEPTEKSA